MWINTIRSLGNGTKQNGTVSMLGILVGIYEISVGMLGISVGMLGISVAKWISVGMFVFVHCKILLTLVIITK